MEREAEKRKINKNKSDERKSFRLFSFIFKILALQESFSWTGGASLDDILDVSKRIIEEKCHISLQTVFYWTKLMEELKKFITKILRPFKNDVNQKKNFFLV